MEFIPTIYSNAICPQVSKLTPGKLFFYQLTGGRKYALSKSEYKILTNPDDLWMLSFYQYLIYLIDARVIPCTVHHFKYVGNMLGQIESKDKKIKKEEKKQEEEKTKKLKKPSK